MSVYVDDMEAPFGRMKMCHMVADTREELLAMADTIGVARKWIQKPEGHPVEVHFDIALSKRALAIAAGAQLVSFRWVGYRQYRLKQGLPVTPYADWNGKHDG
ncbi:MAG TPA: DUF4031 domain-containing protein [Reyranella sp.]|nr:DUF4031 domain-containing protein [Reyranella sp.]